MDLLDLVMAGVKEAGSVPGWLNLLILLKLRADVKSIKRRLGIVERHQKRAPPPEVSPIPAH